MQTASTSAILRLARRMSLRPHRGQVLDRIAITLDPEIIGFVTYFQTRGPFADRRTRRARTAVLDVTDKDNTVSRA